MTDVPIAVRGIVELIGELRVSNSPLQVSLNLSKHLVLRSSALQT